MTKHTIECGACHGVGCDGCNGYGTFHVDEIHHDANGQPSCGAGRDEYASDDEAEVTCGNCLIAIAEERHERNLERGA